MYRVPSVAMIAGTRPTVTSSPLKRPQPMPTATAIAATPAIGSPWCVESVSALMNADRPTMEPTERSMLRVSTTIVCPTATARTTATLTEMLRQFPTVMNDSACTAKIAIATRRAIAMPSSRSRKAAVATVCSDSRAGTAVMRPSLRPAQPP